MRHFASVMGFLWSLVGISAMVASWFRDDAHFFVAVGLAAFILSVLYAILAAFEGRR